MMYVAEYTRGNLIHRSQNSTLIRFRTFLMLVTLYDKGRAESRGIRDSFECQLLRPMSTLRVSFAKFVATHIADPGTAHVSVLC